MPVKRQRWRLGLVAYGKDCSAVDGYHADVTIEPAHPLLSSDSEEYKTVRRRTALTTRRLAGKGWQEAAHQYSALEPELLDLFQTEADKQQVRRVICELILSHLSVAQPAPDESTYELFWQTMLQLGFTNDERKMSMQFFRLRYLIDNARDFGNIEAEFAAFGQGVRKMLDGPDAEMGQHFCDVHESLRKRLAQRHTPSR